MSKNIKIGNDTLNGVTTIKFEDADSAGTYDEFLDTTDANAVASDIADGKTAYVNGVKITGNHTDKTEQTKTAALSMASGDQVVTPDTNKVLTQVTITKPETLVPGNIKKDVVIGGVTGSYEGGVTPSGTINISQNGQVDVTNYATANVAVVSGYVTTPNAYGDTVEIGEGGGQQPTLYAPIITTGVNTVSWANDTRNGGFNVTLTATVDGNTVTSPLTITQEMDGKTLTITASATNFNDGVSTVTLSYIGETSSIVSGHRDIATKLTRSSTSVNYLEYYYNDTLINLGQDVTTFASGDTSIQYNFYATAVLSGNIGDNQLFKRAFASSLITDENGNAVKLNGTLTVKNVSTNNQAVFTYNNSTSSSSSGTLDINVGDRLIYLLVADVYSA